MSDEEKAPVLTQLYLHEARLLELTEKLHTELQDLKQLKTAYEVTLVKSISWFSQKVLEKTMAKMLEEMEQEEERSKQYSWGGFRVGGQR